MDGVSREDVVRICTAATAAPSGDNSQPWRFVFLSPDKIAFHAVSGVDNALLNVDESGTLIALGAAVQNAELEAKALGFDPVSNFHEEGPMVATLTLRKGGSLSESEQRLQQAIPSRHTNRKNYDHTSLKEIDRQSLVEVVRGSSEVTLDLIEDRNDIDIIARALTTMEEIALGNKSLHTLFFKSIFWSKKDNLSGKSGLYIKTLELPIQAQLFFKGLRYWTVAKILAHFKFPKVVAETNAKQNATASAIGVIIISQMDRRHYLEAGRVLERVWLAATAEGLSFQIVTGLLFLARSVEKGGEEVFSIEERKMIREAHARIREVLGNKEAFITFRVGYGSAPSAISYRRPPHIENI